MRPPETTIPYVEAKSTRLCACLGPDQSKILGTFAVWKPFATVFKGLAGLNCQRGPNILLFRRLEKSHKCRKLGWNLKQLKGIYTPAILSWLAAVANRREHKNGNRQSQWHIVSRMHGLCAAQQWTPEGSLGVEFVATTNLNLFEVRFGHRWQAPT